MREGDYPARTMRDFSLLPLSITLLKSLVKKAMAAVLTSWTDADRSMLTFLMLIPMFSTPHSSRYPTN